MSRTTVTSPSEEPSSRKRAAVRSSDALHDGAWLRLKRIHYTTKGGTQRTWEAAERTTRRVGSAADGVLILAKVTRAGRLQLPLVAQMRPPADGYTLEFPAGLLDAGETPEEAAKRELYEETGLSGGVLESQSPPLLLDPGMSNSKIICVVMNVNGDAEANRDARPHPVIGEGEEVEVLYLDDLSLQGLEELARKHQLTIDANLYMYFAGMMDASKPEGMKLV